MVGVAVWHGFRQGLCVCGGGGVAKLAVPLISQPPTTMPVATVKA